MKNTLIILLVCGSFLLSGCSRYELQQDYIHFDKNITPEELNRFIEFFQNNSNNSRYVFSILARPQAKWEIEQLVRVESYKDGIFYGGGDWIESKNKSMSIKKEDVIDSIIFDAKSNSIYTGYEPELEVNTTPFFLNRSLNNGIVVNNTEIISNYDLMIDGEQILIKISEKVISDNETQFEFIPIKWPNNVISTVNKEINNLSIDKIELTLNEANTEFPSPIYYIYGSKEAKLLFIPTRYDVEVTFDAEEGVIKSIHRPFWSYFTI